MGRLLSVSFFCLVTFSITGLARAYEYPHSKCENHIADEDWFIVFEFLGNISDKARNSHCKTWNGGEAVDPDSKPRLDAYYSSTKARCFAKCKVEFEEPEEVDIDSYCPEHKDVEGVAVSGKCVNVFGSSQTIEAYYDGHCGNMTSGELCAAAADNRYGFGYGADTFIYQANCCKAVEVDLSDTEVGTDTGSGGGAGSGSGDGGGTNTGNSGTGSGSGGTGSGTGTTTVDPANVKKCIDVSCAGKSGKSDWNIFCNSLQLQDGNPESSIEDVTCEEACRSQKMKDTCGTENFYYRVEES